MEASSFISLVVILIFLQLGNSGAQTHQDTENAMAIKRSKPEMRGSSFVKVKEELYDIAAAAKEKNIRLGGGKMMLRRVSKKYQKKRQETLRGEDAEISGAAHFVGICDHRGKGTAKAKCKFSNRGSHPTKNKLVGFTAFSADYHVPKSHPPKNN